MSTSGILPLILIISMFLALLMVVVGVIAMAKNGNFNKKHSNKLMRMRVLFQGIAVFVFAAIIYLSR
jgi:predicted permease|tara:strand:+ start:30 stop:230 length:201 start_codon:yes stop_codon:yes gene_type:complete